MEDYQETHDHDSVFSEFSENTETLDMELSEGDTYSSEETFILAVKTYAKQRGFKFA